MRRGSAAMPLLNAARRGRRALPRAETKSTGSMLVGRDLRARRSNERKTQMATKTKAIEVKVDERLAEAISDKAVKAWHATNYSNGRKRVYVTFEEVVSA